MRFVRLLAMRTCTKGRDILFSPLLSLDVERNRTLNRHRRQLQNIPLGEDQYAELRDSETRVNIVASLTLNDYYDPRGKRELETNEW